MRGADAFLLGEEEASDEIGVDGRSSAGALADGTGKKGAGIDGAGAPLSSVTVSVSLPLPLPLSLSMSAPGRAVTNTLAGNSGRGPALNATPSCGQNAVPSGYCWLHVGQLGVPIPLEKLADLGAGCCSAAAVAASRSKLGRGRQAGDVRACYSPASRSRSGWAPVPRRGPGRRPSRRRRCLS